MRVEMSRPDKELWPGVRKADLASYYGHVARWMLPHLERRPLTLVRAPDGVGAGRFFQKDAHHMPGLLSRCEVRSDLHHVMADDVQGLLALADQACVELHGWVSRCDAPDLPDRIVFDLDPPDQGRFPDVLDAARTLCDLLQRRGASVFPLLTGSKGIHVVVPLVPEADMDGVAAFADAVGRVLVRHDDRLTMQVRKAARQGRIFVDTLRNRRKQTSVLPWSTRAVEEAAIALPITVEALQEDVHPRMATVRDRPQQDPWESFFSSAVPLSRIA